MTKDALVAALETCDDPEACWRLLVDFVADWIEHGHHYVGLDSEQIAAAWRQEMGA